MGKIRVYEYADAAAYENCLKSKSLSIKYSDKTVTIVDLVRHAISMGGFSNYSVSRKGRLFYTSLIEMALDVSGDKYLIGQDYKKSEASIKKSISFFMGMVAAKVVAEKVYEIDHLLHLADPAIKNIQHSTGKNKNTNKNSGRGKKLMPDFFGLSKNSEPYLMEAKGVATLRPNGATIKHAKDQVNAIGTVEVDSKFYKGTFTDFNRHVVASGFDKQELVYQDIDPEGKGEESLTINLDMAMLNYYYPMMRSFLEEDDVIIETKKGHDIRFINAGDYKIGMVDDIYFKLERYKDYYIKNRSNKKDYKQLDEIVQADDVYGGITEISSELRELKSDEEMSIGADGIVSLKM